MGLVGFKSRALFFIGLCCSFPTIVFYFSISFLPVYRLVLWGWGLRTDNVCITRSLSLALPTSFHDDDNNNNSVPHYRHSCTTLPLIISVHHPLSRHHFHRFSLQSVKKLTFKKTVTLLREHMDGLLNTAIKFICVWSS